MVKVPFSPIVGRQTSIKWYLIPVAKQLSAVIALTAVRLLKICCTSTRTVTSHSKALIHLLLVELLVIGLVEVSLSVISFVMMVAELVLTPKLLIYQYMCFV